MRRCMKEPRRLKVRHYAARLIVLNRYLASFPEATMDEKMGVTQLNEILLDTMKNSWSKQSYVQGFDCETISFKNSIKRSKRMEISESIYEGVVTASYKKATQAEANRTELSRNKRGKPAL